MRETSKDIELLGSPLFFSETPKTFQRDMMI